MSTGGKNVQVHVEFCSGWGYGRRYEDLRREILAAFPNADVSGSKGRRTSFEVTMNGQLAYSKLQTGKFPDYSSVVKAVAALANNSAPEPIQDDKSSGCCVM